MWKDITLKVTPDMVKDAQGNEKKAFLGHLGTHFDVMDKVFPLEYLRRDAYIFDVSSIKDRDIDVDDIDLDEVKEDMFIGFCSGFIEDETYGTRTYFKEHPQLSQELIKKLIERKISIIGIDFAGIRRGEQHPLADQYCADHGVFVVENLWGLSEVVGRCVVNTYPLNYTDMSGLPCRVIAEVSEL